MIQDTCKRIKKSLRSTESGEVIYVEIGMENIQPRVTTGMVVFFLKNLFEETIGELEAPVIPDTGSKEDARGVPAEDAKEASTLSEKGFEKLMDNWLKKNKRAAFAANNTLQPNMIFGFERKGGAPGPEISIPCPPKKRKMRNTSPGVWIPGPPKRSRRHEDE